MTLNCPKQCKATVMKKSTIYYHNKVNGNYTSSPTKRGEEESFCLQQYKSHSLESEKRFIFTRLSDWLLWEVIWMLDTVRASKPESKLFCYSNSLFSFHPNTSRLLLVMLLSLLSQFLDFTIVKLWRRSDQWSLAEPPQQCHCVPTNWWSNEPNKAELTAVCCWLADSCLRLMRHGSSSRK